MQYVQMDSGLILPYEAAQRRRYPIAIDFFAGAGGMSCGLHQAGWHVIAAVEFDTNAAATYLTNLARPGVQIHFDTIERRRSFDKVIGQIMGVKVDKDGYVVPEPGQDLTQVKGVVGTGWIANQSGPGCEHFWIADIRNLTGEEILRTIGLKPGDVDMVCGGPPCQGFSRAGKQDVMDPRNSLVFEFARLVLEIQPKTIVMENVPGILDMVTPEGVPVMDAFCRVLEDGGFGAWDALKKSLLHSAGVGAAMKGTKGKNGQATDDDDVELHQEQLSLF